MHVRPEGEVSEGGGPGVGEAAGEDGRAGGRGEVLDGAVPHARVDRDHAHVTLDKINIRTFFHSPRLAPNLVSEAYGGHDGHDVEPVVGPGLDLAPAAAVLPAPVLRHDQRHDVDYSQHAQHRHVLQEVDTLRVAQRQDQNN